ncbi:MAG: NADH-quinone oxidoreductase subunit NuoE [Eubacteriales bacterium]|nr:NADH-quinone oxidoreductase subunit NuoE [Eubacteriales bacterium]MDD4323669.1 NADH-quinone oxidoreductase subunit NuoE [Eubacteriales bacterium]MDD4541226.1 NADH-quinone oxidoreductase subunit NuoE [Eubacteriales bacterium]
MEASQQKVVAEQLDLSLIDPVLQENSGHKGSAIAILQEAQEIYGYLPIEVLEKISEVTQEPLAKLYGVATFYTQFRMKPVGKHLIMLCQGTACHVMGADRVQQAIEDELKIENGETTEDGVFTLMTVACLGCCSLAPVMMIDGETYASLTSDSVRKILRNMRKESDA